MISDQFTGFDTIGNATVIVYDRGEAIIATDPWIQGGAYFGSWSLSHIVPSEQRDAVLSSRYIWFSHGHPDHLNPDSIGEFLGKTILLPDHVNGRIRKDLTAMGHKVQVLADRKWTELSERVRVLCISDYYQDAILLIEVNGRLLVDTNDAIDRGWGRFVRKTIRNYNTSVLLSLFGYGDADMIHFYDQDGKFIEPKAAKRWPVGDGIRQATDSYGVTHVIPFSSMHRYQRTDSLWANQYATHLDDYANGFRSDRCELLPAFVRFDCNTDQWAKISPQENESLILTPEHFGDSWSEPLTDQDRALLDTYFQRITHLRTFLDFVSFRVGGSEHTVALNAHRAGAKSHQRGLIFEVPRGSLMLAIEYQIFDDLLIGNFMKTHLHGEWPASRLYPDFTPYVARYADNAYIYDSSELPAYMNEYRKRQPVELFLHQFEQKSIDVFRSYVNQDSKLFQTGKKAYWFFKGLG